MEKTRPALQAPAVQGREVRVPVIGLPGTGYVLSGGACPTGLQGTHFADLRCQLAREGTTDICRGAEAVGALGGLQGRRPGGGAGRCKEGAGPRC